MGGDRAAFFYGTLMAPEVLYRVIYGKSDISHDADALAKAARLTIRDAILYDHCRHRVCYADYPGMVPQKGASVRGTWVDGLTDEDVRCLDWFEGPEYVREKVQPWFLKADGEGADGAREGLVDDVAIERETETYIFIGGADHLESEEWDYEHFRTEKLGNWADASHEYAEVDAYLSGEADGGDPTGGRGNKSGLVEELHKVDDVADSEKLESAV